MCGIAGILHFDGSPVPAAHLQTLIDALVHRGPDGEGSEQWDNVAIGHRRLAIIDPVGGRQPIANEDGQVWVACNGEIYNHRDLRTELTARGHRFATGSDCEAIVHAYEEWGDDCVHHLRGMFAFVVIDRRRRRLLLARDHLGIKPLFWLRQGTRMAFASELQALAKLPGLTTTIDPAAIERYLELQYIPPPGTIFREVQALLPGQRLAFGFDGVGGTPETYWQPVLRPVPGRSAGDWLEAVDVALSESVRLHLMSDVPFGALLSGGIDSALVVSAMCKLLGRAPSTFTIGFAEAGYDERERARAIAAHLGTDHHEAVLDSGCITTLPELVRHHGQPFGDSSALAAWAVAKLARSRVAMVLSGDGADEGFAGYDSYRDWHRWLAGVGEPWWRRGLRATASLIAPGRIPPRLPDADGWHHRTAITSMSERAALWRRERAPLLPHAPELLLRALAPGIPHDAVALAQQADLGTYLPGDILPKVDIASMAHGLEVRTPFADRAVVELAAGIPSSMNAGPGPDGRWQSKRLLRQLFARHLPPALSDGPKRGFAVPVQTWCAPGGPWHALVQERLLASDSPLLDWFTPGGIHLWVQGNRPGRIWLLLMLDEWLRQHRGRGAC